MKNNSSLQLLVAANTQSTKKRKYSKNYNEISTELSLSCYYPRKIMKAATTPTDRIQPPTILFDDCHNLSSSPMKRKYPENQSEISTELTLSCYYPRKIMKPTTTTTDHIQPLTILSSFDASNNLSSSTTLNLLDNSCTAKTTHNPEKISQCSDEGSGVSTELTLSCYPTKIEEKPTTSIISSATKNFSSSIVKISDNNPEKMSPRSGEEKGVSTELTLSFEYKSTKNSSTHNENPWKITKKLTESDVGHMSRLLVSSVEANRHVLPFLNYEIVEKINRDGAKVGVWDYDTNTKHQLVFKRWGSSRSFVFIDRWIPDFVNRRQLKKGDEIGLYWDSSQSRFNFSVLHR